MAVRRVSVGEGERYSKDDDISKNLRIAVAVPTLRAGYTSVTRPNALPMRVRLKKVWQILPILGHCIYFLLLLSCTALWRVALIL